MEPEKPERVGVRELRQNLSVYLRKVQEGETLEVTERGRPVARLTPLAPDEGVIDRLIAEGRIVGARGSIDAILPIEGRPDRKTSRSIMRILREQREDKL